MSIVLVIVPLYNRKNDGSRTYSKVDYCYYCEREFVSRISKHLLVMHANEDDVKRAARHSGEKRKWLLYKIQCMGNYKHNMKVKVYLV